MSIVGNIRPPANPIELSFVIGVYRSRIKAADVERWFAPHYAPELYEVVDIKGPDTLPSLSQAHKEACDILTSRLVSSWHGARAYAVLTSTGSVVLESTKSKPAIMDIGIAFRQHTIDGQLHNTYKNRQLNQKSFNKTLKGERVPAPNLLREVKTELVAFVQHMVKPFAVVMAPSSLLLPAPKSK